MAAPPAPQGLVRTSADEPRPGAGHGASRRLPTAWPVYALFAGYPLWWALGLQAFIWPLLALPMLAWLLRRRVVRAPRGAGIYLLFLCWVVVSALQLDSARQLLAFAYRGSLYASAAVLLLFLANLPRRSVDVAKLAQAAGWMWVATVLGGVLGLVLPGGELPSPLELALPRPVAEQPFINSLVHLELSSQSTLLGYPVARPQAPYNYTNEWGSNLAMLTPLAVYSLQVVRRRWWRVLVGVLLPVAVVPVVVSINRGLWLSLAVVAAYVGLRAAGRGRVRLLLGVLLAAAAAVAAVVLSPLGSIVSDRADRANVQGRAHLYEEAVRAMLDSPLLGHGAPLPSDELGLTAGASVGTHGQFWTLLVSQGVPGLLLFLGFLFTTFALTSRVSRRGLWPHAVVVLAVFQTLFYNSLPTQLHITMLAIALCWWDAADRRGAQRRAPLAVR